MVNGEAGKGSGIRKGEKMNEKCPYCEEVVHEIYECETCGNYGCWKCRTHCPGCHTQMEVVEDG